MARGEVVSGLGTARVRVRMRVMVSDLAMLARSMAISLALGSFGFCMVRPVSQLVCEGGRRGCRSSGGFGGLTYGYAEEEGLEEGIVFGDVLEDLAVVGDVDEDRQGIFSYGLGAIRSVCRLEKSYNRATRCTS